MPLNVIYVSREITMTDADGSNPVPQPSLPEKWQNIVNGNSDLVIRTRKIGERYLQQVTEQRKHYKQSRIESERVLKILKYIDYNFAKEEK